MIQNDSEVIDLESTKILKKLSAVLEDEKNHQIEEFLFVIRMNRIEMTEIREKYGVSRTEFFKIPDPDFKRYFKLRTQNYMMESAISSITAFTKKNPRWEMIDFAKVPDIDPDIHPIGNYRKITKWMVDFCEGDFVEAIILSFFVAMYHNQRKYFLEAVRKNQIFKQYGITKKESESIELNYSYREISNHIFNVATKRVYLKSKIDSLASRGVITVKKALTIKDKKALGLDTRLSTDRTNVYLFHPTPLINYLQPYLLLQTEHDNDIQNSINLLEGKGLLQKTDKGYFMPFQNKKTSGATSHLKKFQAKEAESKTTEIKSYSQIIEEFKKFTKQLSHGSREEFAKLKFKKDGEFIKIIYPKETLTGYQKETIQTFFKNNNTNVYFEDNDN